MTNDERERYGFVSSAEAVIEAFERVASVMIGDTQPAPAPKVRHEFFDEWPQPVPTDDHGYDDAEAYEDDGLDVDGFDPPS